LALPPISGQPAAATRPIADSRAAAQRAFFQAALNQIQAPAAPRQTAAPAAAPPAHPAQMMTPAPATPQVQANAQAPDRLARPGSLLNIRV
jgi:hypothetical protein